MSKPRSFAVAVLPIATTVVASLLTSSCASSGSSAVAATPPVRTVDLPPLVVQATTLPPPTAAPTTAPPPPPPTIVTVPVAASVEPVPVIGRQSGEGARRVQERLLELGFWLQAVNGDFGVTTRQAIMAFQKYRGLVPTESIDEATAVALSEAQNRVHGHSNSGTLLEIDKTRQLMFVVVDGRTEWAINISTGSGIPYVSRDKNEWGKWVRGDSQTPDGIFTINREFEKGWRPGDLGEIYRPKYFNGGIAVHGAYKIPAHPASHGCVRVSTPAMDFLWSSGLAPRGTVVWVHSIS
jgi:peptidoglycan hydrolase-like protein with peptidoglycan-binding domain